jgi:hypothetical protein
VLFILVGMATPECMLKVGQRMGSVRASKLVRHDMSVSVITLTLKREAQVVSTEFSWSFLEIALIWGLDWFSIHPAPGPCKIWLGSAGKIPSLAH